VEKLLHFFYKFFENFRVFNCESGKHFAIERDVLGLFDGDELAVHKSMQAERRVQSGDPEAPETALFGTAVATGVFAGFDNGLLGFGKEVLASPTKTFGRFENILVALFGHYTSFDSCHKAYLQLTTDD